MAPRSGIESRPARPRGQRSSAQWSAALSLLCLVVTAVAAVALQVALAPGADAIALVVLLGAIVATIPLVGWLAVGRSLDAAQSGGVDGFGYDQDFDGEPDAWPEKRVRRHPLVRASRERAEPERPAEPEAPAEPEPPVEPSPPADDGAPASAPAGLLAHAGALNDAGELDAAEAAYREVALGESSLASAASLSLGVLLARRGDLDGAEAAYRAAVQRGGSAARSAQMLLELLESRRGRAG